VPKPHLVVKDKNMCMESYRFKNYFLVVLCLLFFSSCAAFLGIKEPKVQLISDVYKYYNKKGIDTSKVIFIKPNLIDSLTSLALKEFPEKGYTPMQFRLFGPDGYLISHFAYCGGSIDRYNIMDTFPPQNLHPLDSSQTIVGQLMMIDDNIKLISPKNEYNIFIYSQLWTGRMGLKFTQNILDYCSANNINVYIFNTDKH
jgi:hypothetical protein